MVNCIVCGKELSKDQIKSAGYKKREPLYFSKNCSYQSDLRNKKISNSQKGKSLTQEQKNKISNTLKGRKLSEETINKLKDKRKYRVISDDMKKKISESLKSHSVSKETKLKISRSLKGEKLSEETRNKMSKSRKGRKRPDVSKFMKKFHKGKTLSEDHKNKISKTVRLQMIELTKLRLEKNEQLIPNWNPQACDYFENFDKENKTLGRHARNGGEFYIKELGYWLDYINHDLKLIIEYDEKYHQNKNQRKKDMKRQREIQEIYPDYEFKRINDQEVK